MNRLQPLNYNLVADGVKSNFTATGGGGTQSLTECETGFCGQIKFPARLDHSHPLNVMSASDIPSGKTINDYVKPIGATASFGSNPHYARVDHVHAFVSPTGGTYKTFSSSMVSDKDHGQTLRSDTWNIGRDKPNGVQVKLITRETLVGEGWEQKHCFFFRNAQISNMGTIINIGAEEGCIVVAV